MASNPGVLTEEIAKALVEDWADGKSFAAIIRELQSEGHKIHPCDVTWWVALNTEVTIFSESHTLRDLLQTVYPYRVMDLINSMIQIADDGAVIQKLDDGTVKMTDPRHVRNQINARKHAIDVMTPKWANVEPTEEDMGFVIPYNPLFEKASKDAKPN